MHEGKGNVAFPKKTMHPVQPDEEVLLDRRVVLERWPHLDDMYGPRVPKAIQKRKASVQYAEWVGEHGEYLYTVQIDIRDERDHPFFTPEESRIGYVELIFWQDMITAVCE